MYLKEGGAISFFLMQCRKHITLQNDLLFYRQYNDNGLMYLGHISLDKEYTKTYIDL